MQTLLNELQISIFTALETLQNPHTRASGHVYYTRPNYRPLARILQRRSLI